MKIYDDPNSVFRRLEISRFVIRPARTVDEICTEVNVAHKSWEKASSTKNGRLNMHENQLTQVSNVQTEATSQLTP